MFFFLSFLFFLRVIYALQENTSRTEGEIWN